MKHLFEDLILKNRLTSPGNGKTGILLVGERANSSDGLNFHGSGILGRLSEGAFTEGPSRKRLLSIGLSWDLAVNLLPGMPTRVATWTRSDRAQAVSIMRELFSMIESGTLHGIFSVVTLGMRPSQIANEAIHGSRVTVLNHLDYFRFNYIDVTCIPHPSGANRFWNERTQEAVDWISQKLPRLKEAA